MLKLIQKKYWKCCILQIEWKVIETTLLHHLVQWTFWLQISRPSKQSKSFFKLLFFHHFCVLNDLSVVPYYIPKSLVEFCLPKHELWQFLSLAENMTSLIFYHKIFLNQNECLSVYQHLWGWRFHYVTDLSFSKGWQINFI